MKSEKSTLTTSTFIRKYSNIIEPKFAKAIPFKGEANNLRIYNNDIYLKRFDTQLIVKIDSLGNEIATFGLSPKTGASIFSFIIFWTITSDGIEVVDGKTSTISLLDFEGKIKNSIVVPRKIMRAIRLERNRYLLKIPDPKDETNEIYEVFNLEDLTLRSVDFPSFEIEHKDFVFDGFFVGNQSEAVYHICYKTGRYFVFDKTGKFLFDKTTLDASGFPNIIVTHDGAKRYHPLTIKTNVTASVTDSNLYILSGMKSTNNPDKVGNMIDVYESLNGNYSNTIVLPFYKNNPSYEILITDKRLLALQGNFIVEYKL